MDDETYLADDARAGEVVDTEPVFELTPEAMAYLAQHGGAASHG